MSNIITLGDFPLELVRTILPVYVNISIACTKTIATFPRHQSLKYNPTNRVAHSSHNASIGFSDPLVPVVAFSDPIHWTTLQGYAADVSLQLYVLIRKIKSIKETEELILAVK